jgi:hypothetical protein
MEIHTKTKVINFKRILFSSSSVVLIKNKNAKTIITKAGGFAKKRSAKGRATSIELASLILLSR